MGQERGVGVRGTFSHTHTHKELVWLVGKLRNPTGQDSVLFRWIVFVFESVTVRN